MIASNTPAPLQALLASPQPQASAWLRWQDRIGVLASIDACGIFLRLVVPLGMARHSHDAELASNLLGRNARNLDAGSPCFGLDERDGTVCLCATLPLSALTPMLAPELVGAALERMATAADEARGWLPDTISFVD